MAEPASQAPLAERGRWRQALLTLAQRGELAPEAVEPAFVRLGIVPDVAACRTFADRVLLAAGVLLILSGIVFFFAYNWAGLHRFVRIGLVAVPLLGSAFAAHHAMNAGAHLGRHSLEAALGSGVVLTGVLLAVVGQIYQTGADSELLFAAWALFALPWVIVAAVPWLWLFWLLLLNVALGLYLAGRADVWALFALQGMPLWWPLLLNGSALILWEGLARRGVLERTAYGPRLVALWTTLAVTFPALFWVFEEGKKDWPGLEWTPIYYGLWAVAVSFYYRWRVRDIVPLALLAGSLVCVLNALLARQLFVGSLVKATSFLLLGLAIAGMSAVATGWLRYTVRLWAGESGGTGEAEEQK